jgi:hypothetical protein
MSRRITGLEWPNQAGHGVPRRVSSWARNKGEGRGGDCFFFGRNPQEADRRVWNWF